MGGTWLVRGGAAAVVAVLAGAWAVGVSGQGDVSTAGAGTPHSAVRPTPQSPPAKEPSVGAGESEATAHP